MTYYDRIPRTGKTKLMKIAATKIAKLKKKPVSVVVVKAGKYILHILIFVLIFLFKFLRIF